MALFAGAGAVTYARDGFRARHVRPSDAAHFVEYYELMRKHDDCGRIPRGVRFHGLADAGASRCDRPLMHRRRPRARRSFSGATRLRKRCRSAFANNFRRARHWRRSPHRACRPALEHFVSLVRCRRGGVSGRTTSLSTAIRRLGPSPRDPRAEGRSRRHRLANGHLAATGAWRPQRAGGRTVAAGPPTLPGIFSSAYLKEPRAYVELGLEQSDFDVDRRLSATLAGLPGVTYLSALDQLCREDGCLAQVPGEGALDLIVRLRPPTPKGSSYPRAFDLEAVFDNLLRSMSRPDTCCRGPFLLYLHVDRCLTCHSIRRKIRRCRDAAIVVTSTAERGPALRPSRHPRDVSVPAPRSPALSGEVRA